MKTLETLLTWSQKIGQVVSLEKEYNHSIDYLSSLAELERDNYIKAIEVDFFIEYGLDPLLSSFLGIYEKEGDEEAFNFLEKAGIKGFKKLYEKEDSLDALLSKIKSIVDTEKYSDNIFSENIATSIEYKFEPTEKIHELLSSLITKYQNHSISRFKDDYKIPVLVQTENFLK